MCSVKTTICEVRENTYIKSNRNHKIVTVSSRRNVSQKGKFRNVVVRPYIL